MQSVANRVLRTAASLRREHGLDPVLECSVVGRPHPDWGEEVVAFVVPRPGASVEPASFDRMCLERIARFKRPKHYRFVEELPKNNYGKVLKTELRKSLQEDRG